MKYLCLCYYNQNKFDALSRTDLEQLAKECQPHDESLHRSGQLLMAGSLAFPRASKVIRPGTSKPVVTEGPYAVTSEPVGAFFLIEAKDMDDAMQIAARHPGAHMGRYLGGGIEVRPIEEP